MTVCPSTLAPVSRDGFSPSARKALAGGVSRAISPILPFTRVDLKLPLVERKTRRNSISGVQDKVNLALVGGRFTIVERGGDYILKPAPLDPSSRFRTDIPANEHLTMQIASQVFGIETAANACVWFKDGECAYLTRRFDRRDGLAIPQEDFCQLSNRTEETHGRDYKYDASYEEMAKIVRRVCPAHRIEVRKLFFRILFCYAFANGDAHLKNFSVYRSAFGDYVLTPAYDLLNTQLHYPDGLDRMALRLFEDPDYTTPAFDVNGFYTFADFERAGASFGLSSADVRKMIELLERKRNDVEALVGRSLLSPDARQSYLQIYDDRIRALKIGIPVRERFQVGGLP